ncbi:MAG: hypothetical protein KJ922_04775 [Nanoarchaeota archaeon]|nr:hypothetical protein [Nanoarchaeota archaeon]
MAKLNDVLKFPGKNIPPVDQWRKAYVEITAKRIANFDSIDQVTRIKNEHSDVRGVVSQGTIEAADLPKLPAEKVPAKVLHGDIHHSHYKTLFRRRPGIEIDFYTEANQKRIIDVYESDHYSLVIEKAA